ncbi:aromatic prenyltransferase [Aspergillus pseudoustus]|uniref:Aromatic prenyltransferase n=1 Tax=Aspergillus pseudoustus TaxID=1810923 RepID=A0ABR4ILB5_9EURO
MTDSRQTTTPNAVSAFHSINTYLRFPTRDQEQWWANTGPIIARMLETAGYSLEQQFQYLIFHSSQIVPRLGAYTEGPHYNFSPCGLPIELSVNYQQKRPGRDHSTVRIAIEPLDSYSGTERDPFNMAPMAATVNELERMRVIKDFDRELFLFFAPKFALNREEQSRFDAEIPGGATRKNQGIIAFDLNTETINVKAYTQPGHKAHLAGVELAPLLTEHLHELKAQGKIDCLEPWSKVADYVTEINGWGFHNLWAWDYVTPSKTRFKFYTWLFDVPDIAKLDELYTLNNRAPGTAQALDALHTFWDTLNPKGLGGKAPLPLYGMLLPENTTPMLLNYEIKAGNPHPDSKVYFALYGYNDLVCIQQIAKLFELLGWDELAASYPATVQSFYPGHDLSKTSHLLYWISFAYSDKTGAYTTVYYHANPELK